MLEAAGFVVTVSSLREKPSKENEEVFTLYCVIAAALVLIAGLMSGLTLGLMSLDALDLEVGHSTCIILTMHRKYVLLIWGCN